MKIARIDWRLFWHALNQQDSASRNRWLWRWVFADDGVTLSRQAAPPEATRSDLTDAYEGLENNADAERTRRTGWTAPRATLGSKATMELNESMTVV
jgi:hypothetical protein